MGKLVDCDGVVASYPGEVGLLSACCLRCADIGLLLDPKHTLESRILNLNRMSELLDKP